MEDQPQVKEKKAPLISLLSNDAFIDGSKPHVFPQTMIIFNRFLESEREVVFRNYTPLDGQSFHKATLEQLKQVALLEKVYAKKTQKAIKAQIQAEDSLGASDEGGLIPKNKNADLKRCLSSKLERLSLQTEKAVYEIISK